MAAPVPLALLENVLRSARCCTRHVHHFAVELLHFGSPRRAADACPRSLNGFGDLLLWVERSKLELPPPAAAAVAIAIGTVGAVPIAVPALRIFFTI
jgi:hypothetical protein